MAVKTKEKREKKQEKNRIFAEKVMGWNWALAAIKSYRNYRKEKKSSERCRWLG